MAAGSKSKGKSAAASWPITGAGILAGAQAAARAQGITIETGKPKKRRHVIEGKVRYIDASLHGPALAKELDRIRAEITAEGETEEPIRPLTEVLAEAIAAQACAVEVGSAAADQVEEEAVAAVAIATAAGTVPDGTKITAPSDTGPARADVVAITSAKPVSPTVELTLSVAEFGMVYGALGRFAYRAFDSWGAAALAPGIGTGEDEDVDFTRPHLDVVVKAVGEQLTWLRTKAKDPAQALVDAIEELLGRLEAAQDA